MLAEKKGWIFDVEWKGACLLDFTPLWQFIRLPCGIDHGESTVLDQDCLAMLPLAFYLSPTLMLGPQSCFSEGPDPDFYFFPI